MEIFRVIFWLHGGVFSSYLSSCFPWHSAYAFNRFMFVSPSGFLLLKSLLYSYFTDSSSCSGAFFSAVLCFLFRGISICVWAVSLNQCFNCFNRSYHEWSHLCLANPSCLWGRCVYQALKQCIANIDFLYIFLVLKYYSPVKISICQMHLLSIHQLF